MTPYSWPATLPKFLRDPYSVSPRPGSLELNVGVQTAFARVFTQANEIVQCEALLSSAQEQDLRTFFKTTLSMGTQWFTAPILRNGGIDDYEVMFLGAPPAYVPANKAGYVRARFTLLTRGDQAPPGPPHPLACPGLTIPIDGSSVGSVTSTTLLWTAVSGAATYRVYVWEDGDPQPGSPTTTTALLTYEATGLTTGLTYRWTVDAVSAEDEVSAGCESATFILNEADATIQWQSAAFTGDILADEVTLTAVRTGDTSGSVSADYDFTEATALFGADFVATPGTVTFLAGEVTKDVVVPLVRDYDTEVLADSPWAYIKFNDADDNSGIFDDLAPSDRDFTATSGEADIFYQQPALNLSASLSAYHAPGGANFAVDRNWGSSMDASQSLTICGWVKFSAVSPTLDRAICFVGGGGGSANVTRGQLYRRGSDGALMLFWQAFNPGGTATTHYVALTTPCPALGEEFWFCWAMDQANEQFKVRINTSLETVAYGALPPWQIVSTNPARYTHIEFASSLNVSWRNRPVGGSWAQFEFYTSVYTPERWTRWNLDASLNFIATLSNPVGATLGAIDETVMTIEAP